VLAWPPPGLGKEHAKAYTMGFVASAGGCSAAWDGLTPVGSDSAIHRIKDVPGEVVLAFGGPHAMELAQSCDDVDDLTAAYRKAIDLTDPSGIDFDLPEVALGDGPAMRRRIEALTRIQRDGDRPLSLTLPLHRSGLSDAALDALRTAVGNGLRVEIVNLVPSDRVGRAVTAAAITAHAQLMRLYHQDDAQVWRRMGVTPVIGVGIAGVGAPFRPADARQLLGWAAARGLGRLSMWSLTRDAPCTVDTSVAGDTCSGLDEDAGVFAKIFQTFGAA
jgi:chitinase